MLEFNEKTLVKKVTRPVPCPLCAETGLEIHEMLISVPLGFYSISGNQGKVIAKQVLFLYCPSCKARARGEVSMDGPALKVRPEDMRVEEDGEI